MPWNHKCPNGAECLNHGDLCDGGWLCCRDMEKCHDCSGSDDNCETCKGTGYKPAAE